MSYNIVDITVAPSSVNTSLYTLANFTCDGIGDILEWTIQGHSLTDSIKQSREISVTTNNISVDVWSSVLTIRALPINDGISIRCDVVSFNPFGIIQKGAALNIKGRHPILLLCCYNKHNNFHLHFKEFHLLRGY